MMPDRLHKLRAGLSCSMLNIKRRPDWAAIKAEYLAGKGSLRQLAEGFGISQDTLEKRCAREGWRREMAALCGKVAAAAEATAVERGREMGFSAAEFVERSQRETERWLDRIEAMAKEATLSPDSMQKLVNSWRATLAAGREAFNLDLHSEQTVIFGAVMLDEFCPIPIEAEVCEAKSGE